MLLGGWRPPKMIKAMRFLLGLLFLTFACSLSAQRFSRPTISTGRGWTVEEHCVSQGCYPLSDFLTTKDLTIRVDALNHLPYTIRDGIFLIRVMFPQMEGKDVEFDPAQSVVELGDHRSERAKGIACAGTIMDRSYMLSAPSVIGYRQIDHDNYCYFLFFDIPPPPVENVFILKLNGVRQRGRRVEIPDIIFRPRKG